jgi:putative ABC transport system ATP-binding protein
MEKNTRRSEVVIELDHVVKVYGTKKTEYTAIRDISMSVKKGEFVSVLGPSGSGKTTLMNLIGTLDRPTSGRILLDGVDTSTLDSRELAVLRNRKIGFIFQSYNLVPYLNMLENVTLPLIVDGLDTTENIERGREMLKEVGLDGKLALKPNELSGGQQQRVAIVRALINRPPIVLADEPTGNLDSKTSDAVMQMLKRMAKENNITIVMVTHEQDIAEFSERSIYLKDGIIEKYVTVKK